MEASRRRGLLATYAALIVVVTVITVVGALLALMLRPAHYVSSARVVVQPQSIGGAAPLAPNMGTEREYAVSGDVTHLAATAMGASDASALAGLSVTVPVDTTVLQFSYSADTAAKARSGADAFSRAYIAYRLANPGTTTGSGAHAGRGSSETPFVAMISAPTLPANPAKPNYPLVLGLSLMVGAMLGAGCAFVWDRLSGKLRGLDDIEAQTQLPLLGAVPALSIGAPDAIAVLADPPVRGAEAYGYLAARMLHLLETRHAGTALITSPSTGAGKTTLAVNLATALAFTGKPVVLVSADLRNPTLHECFGIEREPGLTDVLRATSNLPRVLNATQVTGLQLLTAGSPAAPGEAILNIEDVDLLLQRLSLNDAVVILDAPSIIGSAETALLADRVDLVLMVVDTRRGTRAQASTAVSLLRHIDDTFLAVVANDPGRRRRRRRSSTPPGPTAADPVPAAPDVPPPSDAGFGWPDSVPAPRSGTS